MWDKGSHCEFICSFGEPGWDLSQNFFQQSLHIYKITENKTLDSSAKEINVYVRIFAIVTKF